MYKRLSSSRSPTASITDFAGGPNPHTMLSSMSGTLLSMFNTQNVRPLRTVCKDFKNAIADQPWSNRHNVKDLEKWRACFPRAITVDLSNNVTDADCVHLQGVQSIHAPYCWRLTGADFNLICWWLEVLDIKGCCNITDDNLGQLVNLKRLDITCCRSLTGVALDSLINLTDLRVCRCNGLALEAIKKLPNAKTITVVPCCF